MTNGPISNLKSKQKKQSSLLEELNAPLRDFVADFKAHGADVLQKVREDNPEKYLELSTKLLPLVATLNPGTNDFSDAKDMQSIGIKLLRSIGFNDPDEDSIQAAITAQDDFIARLQQIQSCAQAPEGEVN